MINKVPIHIKVTERPNIDPKASKLVFETLRIGLPDNPVIVWAEDKIGVWKGKNSFTPELVNTVGPNITHWDWIYHLIMANTEPFFILDTDVVFSACVYNHFPNMNYIILGGEHIPQHADIFTGAVMCGKLHTSFMYINPNLLALVVHQIFGELPLSPNVSKNISLIAPFYYYVNNVIYYHDTLSDLFHALNPANCFWYPKALTDCFVHLHAGSWVDCIKRDLPDFGNELELAHKMAYNGTLIPSVLRTQQREYYLDRQRIAEEMIKNESATLPPIPPGYTKPSEDTIPLQQ